MAGDDDDLLGVFGSLPVGDDVEAGGVGQGLRCEGEVHGDGTLAGEVGEQVGVFGGDGGGGDFVDARGVHGHAGVGDAVVGSADGADEDGGGADAGSGDGSGGAVLDGVAVGVDAAFLGGELLVEVVVEEEDFAFERWRGRAP